MDQQKQFYLLELFHGPTFAFKDVALQLLGNLFEYFLVRKNGDKPESEREHLTVVGATSGDTGSAAIYGLRSKKDVSAIIGDFIYHTESWFELQDAYRKQKAQITLQTCHFTK